MKPFSDWLLESTALSKFEININVGLDIGNPDSPKNTPENINKRRLAVEHEITKFAHNVKFKFIPHGTKHTPCTDEGGNEPTLVAQFDGVDEDAVIDFCNEMCDKFDQWAIAYFNTKTMIGNMVGKKAKEWGGFNISCFMRYWD
jgi:hypothetical protein